MSAKTLSPSVNIAEIPDILNICYKAKITPNLVGTQGIGKSETVREYAKKYKFDGVIDLRLGQMEIGDLIGLPKVETVKGIHKTIWAQPVWWPDSGKWVIFLDEWNRAATTDVIQAIFQLILDRRLHTHVLPEDCTVVAAMNPADAGFMVNKIRDKALSDRMLHLNIQPTSEGWLKWAVDTKVDSDVIDFIRVNSSALGTSNFTMERREATPRAWTTLSRVFKSCTQSEWENYGSILSAGLVGPEQAVAFIKFKADRNYKPFKAEDILLNYPKHQAKINEWINKDNFRSDVIIATLDNLVAHFGGFKKQEEFKAAHAGKSMKTIMENYAAFVQIVPKDVAKKHSGDIVKLLSTCDSTYILGIIDVLAESVDITPDKKGKDVSTK